MASRSFHSLHFWRFFSHRPRLVFSLLLIIFIVWLAGCAGNPPKDDIPGDTQSEAGTNIPSEPDQTIQADWSIQRFSTTNANGDEITLTIPAFSITPDDVIELIPLDSPPPGPFAQSEFPGVLIQPSGLRLPAAAYLDITLANSPTNLAESPTTWLFKAVDSNYAIPLATELLDDGRTLRTQLYSFSTIFAATPTAEEVETIYEIIEGRLETLPRDFADLVDVVVVCAGHIKQLRLFGNFAEAGSLHERLFKKILDDREIVLTLPQGTDPCYAYLPMLLKFRQGLGILLEPLLEVMDRIVQNPNLYPDETAANAAFDEAFYFVGARPLAEKILDFNEENAQ
ncbi:MAG: hypothetical protein GWN00_29890, partial [Aliifodinibius sp.]|nr:hypothetical protein [Fodinibius sp.]NIY28850.1 hypothetical protein [Fodinibius sp.]